MFYLYKTQLQLTGKENCRRSSDLFHQILLFLMVINYQYFNRSFLTSIYFIYCYLLLLYYLFYLLLFIIIVLFTIILIYD